MSATVILRPQQPTLNFSASAQQGPAGADSGATYATYGALAAVPGRPATGTTVYVRGYAAANDGGGGTFIYQQSSGLTPNGGTILAGTTGTDVWQRDHSPNEYHAAWFGIFGAGADEGAAFNSLITSLGSDTTLVLGDGTYVLETGVALAADYLMIGGQGASRTILKAKDGSDFSSIISATSRSGVHLMNLTIDANRANRTSALTQRALGIAMTGMTDLRLVNLTVKNTYGFGSVSAVGIAVSGASSRCQAVGCNLIDCGVSGHASDGIFFSGTDMLIDRCTADSCTDTGFVLEKANNSRIQNCVARSCNAAAAITAALANTDYANNVIDGLDVWGWNATNTGGIQIGALSTLSNLYNTQVSNVNFYGNGGVGIGPALYFRKTSTGVISGVNVSNINVYGGSAQGILIEAEKVLLHGILCLSTALAPIQCRVGASDVTLVGSYLSATTGQFGLYVDGTSSAVNNVVSKDNTYVGASVSGSYGIYFAGTNTGCASINDTITGFSTARVGSDAGTVPVVNSPINLSVGGGFTFGKQADVNLYRNAADQLKTDDQMVATGAFVMKTKAGPPSDSDLAVVTVGACILDITNNEVYFRVTGGWKKAALV